MRTIKHWTPRYIFARFRNTLSNRLHPDWPWLTPGAVDFLNLWLRPSDDVFEWGSGRSTIWIGQRVHSITSIETNNDWFVRVRSVGEQKGLRNINLRFFAPDGGPDNIAAYASLIKLAGAPLDVTVVDGLYRDYCALAATGYLKPGGLLLIDNVNWYLPSPSRSAGSRRDAEGPASALWADFSDRVKSWRRIWTSDGVTDTAMWIKTP